MEAELIRLPNGTFLGLIILVFCSIEIQASIFSWNDFDFAGFDNINCSLVETKVRIRRFNRTCFAFSGTIDMKSERFNDWEVEFIILYSAKGNNQFVKLPYKIPKDDLCNFADGAFTHYGPAQTLADASDLPAPQTGVSLCTLYKRKVYTLKDLSFSFENNNLVKFLQPGYYKAQLIFSGKYSDESAMYSVHVRFY